MNTSKLCFQCGKQGADMYGYTICDSCKSKLGLFTDETIKKHITLYNFSKNQSYENEILDRLSFIDKDYIKKKIKLLHILERLKNIN
jgi:hypothetical protein